MTYNFDEIIDRRNTNSENVEGWRPYIFHCGPERVFPYKDEEFIRMWVADMEFAVAPEILQAITDRVDRRILFYTLVYDMGYYEALRAWCESRYGWSFPKEQLTFSPGVIPALYQLTEDLVKPLNGKVLTMTPAYGFFLHACEYNGVELVTSPLREEGGRCSVDWEDFETKAADPDVKLLMLCNPHNPAGRVWTREELTRLGDICLRHGVTVVSDEIHCELVYPGHTYTPFASLSEEFRQHSVTCVSPSKSFNMAGLQIATIVAADDDMRRRIDKAININEVCDVNPFGVLATIAAYNEGEEWLTQLLAYLHANYRYMQAYCEEHLPDFPLTRLEGTYLVWMDTRALRQPSEELEHRLTQEARLWLNAGTMYGAEGEGFMRWNIACPKSVLHEGLERFRQYAEAHRQHT